MSVVSTVIREDELIERLLAQQPSAKTTLERLRMRFEGRSGYGAFAPIRNRGYHLRQLRSLPLHRRR
jgi:hypothetical protein